MPVDIILLLVLVVPVVVLAALRINAAMVFLSLCLGEVLVQFVAKDADSLIAFVAPESNSVSASTLHLIMLFLPVLLTSIIMLLSIHGRGRVAMNILPAMGVSLLALLLAVPLLPTGVQDTIEVQNVWKYLSDAQAMIIGASALISLLFLWTQRRKAHKDAEKHSH